jgi:phage terminase large subunit
MLLAPPRLKISLPPKFRTIFQPYRFKFYRGGRGSSKSHSIGRYLLVRALQRRVRILCTREFQNSIQDSVHRLLSDVIGAEGLSAFFDIQRNTIRSVTGSSFIFDGLAHNIQSIKSTEGIDICWVEEAEHVSAHSWDILVPTIRNPGSEIIASYNPQSETDPTHVRAVVNPVPGTLSVEVNWRDNPWFPEVLMSELLHCRAHDYDKYLHMWEGHTRVISGAQVFRSKYVVEAFESPPMDGTIVKRYGLDFGFGPDPVAGTCCFIKGDELFIEHEAFGYHLDLQQVGPLLVANLPGVKGWKIRADNSRPETIGYLKHQDGGAFNIEAAKKWSGSVEDGIEFMRSFRRIVVHPRCKNTIYEMGAYSYKIDKLTNDVLPVLIDAHNHCIDSIRYALDPLIQRKATIYDSGVV